MSYSVISQMGTITSTAYSNPTVTATSNTGTGSGFVTGTSYGFVVDGYNSAGRTPYVIDGGFNPTTTGNDIVVTVTIPTGLSGTGIWYGGTSGGITYYHYADITAAGVITYKNGASSGISVSVNGNTLTVTISQPGPASGSDVWSSTFAWNQQANTVSTTITVPTGQNWLIKSFVASGGSFSGTGTGLTYGAAVVINGIPFYQMQSSSWLYLMWSAYPGSSGSTLGGNVSNYSADVFPAILVAGTSLVIAALSSNGTGSGYLQSSSTIYYALTGVTI